MNSGEMNAEMQVDGGAVSTSSRYRAGPQDSHSPGAIAMIGDFGAESHEQTGNNSQDTLDLSKSYAALANQYSPPKRWPQTEVEEQAVFRGIIGSRPREALQHVRYLIDLRKRVEKKSYLRIILQAYDLALCNLDKKLASTPRKAPKSAKAHVSVATSPCLIHPVSFAQPAEGERNKQTADKTTNTESDIIERKAPQQRGLRIERKTPDNKGLERNAPPQGGENKKRRKRKKPQKEGQQSSEIPEPIDEQDHEGEAWTTVRRPIKRAKRRIDDAGKRAMDTVPVPKKRTPNGAPQVGGRGGPSGANPATTSSSSRSYSKVVQGSGQASNRSRPKPPPKEDFAVLVEKEGLTPAVLSRQLSGKLDFSSLGISRCRQTRNGVVMATASCETRDHLCKILEESLPDCKVRVPGKRDPVVELVAVPVELDLDALKALIWESNPGIRKLSQTTVLESLTLFAGRTSMSTRAWKLRTTPEIFDVLFRVQKRRVQIGFTSTLIRKLEGPQLCFKCWGQGHLAKDCKNSQVCAFCSEEGHDFKSCSARLEHKMPQCINCQRCKNGKHRGHAASAPTCPFRERCKEMIASRTNYGNV